MAAQRFRRTPWPFVIVVSTGVAGIVIAGIGGYSAGWSWTGFQDNGTLWDWLELFLLPAALALLPLWLRLSRTKGLLRYYVFAASVLAFAVLLIGGYLGNWTWTGFQDRPVQPDDGGPATTITVTLWDWLTVALLPLTIALVPAWLESRSTHRTSWRVAFAGIAGTFVVLIIGGYRLDWLWTGFSGNTLWDWLHMLLVPFLLPLSLAYIEDSWSQRSDEDLDLHTQPASREAVSPLPTQHSGSPATSTTPGWGRSGTATVGDFVAATPVRIADFRTRLQIPAALPTGRTVALQVTGLGSVPANGVDAALLTVTAVAPQRSGYITVAPTGAFHKPTSTLTFPGGGNTPNTVTVPIGVNGKIDLFNGSTEAVQLVVDVSGYTKSPAVRGFSSSIQAIDERLARRMATSWLPGCPVPMSGLRLLTLNHRGFDGADHVGELVVAAAVASGVVQVFRELYDHKYPIESIRLVDDFGGNAELSMAANNSSAFNCRPITGCSRFWGHSYGTAIDLNPVQNPYVNGNVVIPEHGKAFLARAPAPGVICAGDAVVTAFTRIGWAWSGSWSGPTNYQHFSVTG